MTSASTADCIVVGYNDVDFDAFVARQKAMAQYSGAYDEMKWNSLIFRGRRMLPMDCMNQVITQATGVDPRLNVFEVPGAGVLYLKDYLDRRGFNVEIISFFTYEKERFRALLADGPRAVAITTTFYVDSDPVTEIVRFVREHNPDVAVVVGGPHVFNLCADLDPETRQDVFAAIGADVYVSDSQGENTLSRVLAALRDGTDLGAIPNLHYRRGGVFESTGREVEDNDLDQNAVDWSRFDPQLLRPMVYLRTARSCPFVCAFCNYPEMAGAHVLNSVEVVERQLRAVQAAGAKVVAFIDDTFNFPLPRFKDLLRMMIRNRFTFRWVSFLRCTNVDAEAIELMQESGCLGVLLGIESGDQGILKLMKKAAKPDRYRWAMGELHQRGIATLASMICGFPGETEQSVRNTIAFLEETAPTFFTMQLYYHDTRAPIQKRKDELAIRGAGFSWKHHTMDWREAVAWTKYTVQSVHNSIPMGLYGFSMWGVGYLVSRGVPLETIKDFGRVSRDLVLHSLDDDFSADCADQERRLVGIFRRNETAIL